MNPLASLYAQALRLTKPRAEIDALLLYASKTNHPFFAQAALEAGADIHVFNDRPLRSASYAGYTRTAKILLRFYKLPQDSTTLNEIKAEAARFENPNIDKLLTRVLEPA